MLVAQPARQRPGHEETDSQRQQEDARPQRRALVAVAAVGEPDALQPDDEDELQPTARHRGQEACEVAEGEGPDLEQTHVQHRVLGPRLDDDEGYEQGDPAEELGQDRRGGPAHRARAVRLDAVGHPVSSRPRPRAKVTLPGRSSATLVPDADLVERGVGPDRAEDAERHAHPEHGPPVPLGEDPADHQAQEPSCGPCAPVTRPPSSRPWHSRSTWPCSAWPS